MAADPTLLTAAIVHAPNESVDDVLSSFVQELADDGVRVQGLLQKLRCGAPGGSCSVDLVDITTRETYPIFQDLGKGSTACRLDPAGVVASSIVLRRALEARADLIVANRFGSMEREGRGLAQEMLAAMADRIPVYVVHGIHGDIAFSFGIGIVSFRCDERRINAHNAQMAWAQSRDQGHPRHRRHARRRRRDRGGGMRWVRTGSR